MQNIFNVSTQKVGGLRFFKIGRLNISFSVSREFKPVRLAAKPVVEADGQSFKGVVKLYRNGKSVSSHSGPARFNNAGDAMAHALAGIVACNLKIVR